MLKDTIIGTERIDDRAVLRRVLNPAGVPYSLILIDGVEMLNTTTDKEKQMIGHYKENKKIYIRA